MTMVPLPHRVEEGLVYRFAVFADIVPTSERQDTGSEILFERACPAAPR